MVFLENHARWLLVLHAVLGAATVAVTSHLALWAWKLMRGDAGRLKGVRWFAYVGLAVYALQFTVGNLLYPTYKVRVRGEYLDAPAAILDDVRARRASRMELARRAGVAETAAPDTPPPRLSGIARLFDVKEHWVALGLPLLLAAALLARRYPTEGNLALGRLLLACALLSALLAWFGGIVGLVVTSYRSVGAPG